MSTELFLPLYFGLVPVILVAGIVQANRKRHRLGSRARKLLVAGAGLLLLLHLSAPLRPLLLDAIFEEGFPISVGAVVAAVSLLHLLLQAAGLGLIIAAALTSRSAIVGGAPATDDPDKAQPSRPATRFSTAAAAVAAIIALAGLALGFGLGRWTVDPHTAKAKELTGTVTWSNESTRLAVFEADGETRDPLDGDTVYYILSSDWRGPDGNYHSGYPACLSSEDEHPVSEGRHRVTLTVIHRDTGGRQAQNIATHVHCLD